jgi:hypothetical protein
MGIAGRNALEIERVPDEDGERTLVRARLHPVVNAACTARQFNPELAESHFGTLVAELSQHVNDVKANNMNRPEATSDKIENDLTNAILDGGGRGWKKLVRDMEFAFARMVLHGFTAAVRSIRPDEAGRRRAGYPMGHGLRRHAQALSRGVGGDPHCPPLFSASSAGPNARKGRERAEHRYGNADY